MGLLNQSNRTCMTASNIQGGGLVLTALAARSLFKSGVAFRIMAANPCTSRIDSSLIYCVHDIDLQGPCLVSVWSEALDR
jgi:hypothetical protein